MPADMGRDLGHLHPVDLVVLLSDVLKILFPVHRHHGHPILIHEQRRRAQENGVKIHTAYGESIYRSRKEQFMDYAVAVKNGLEWNHDRAMYGLLNNERSI